MTVKDLKREDIPLLISANKYFSDGWNENMLTSAFDSCNFFGKIAFTDNEFSGFITYSVALDTADINDIFVFEKFRKKGIAKTLLKQVISDLKSKGVNKLFLEVREGNIPAKNLYEFFGFKLLSVRKKYYGDGENAINYYMDL